MLLLLAGEETLRLSLRLAFGLDESLRSCGAIGRLLGLKLLLGLLLLLAGMILMLMTDVILCGFPAGATLAARGCVDEGFSGGVMWYGW